MDTPEHRHRHRLFADTCRRVGWTHHQLWLHTIAAGGTLSAFDVDAFLTGLVPLPPFQQDMLAATLNERLTDLYTAAKLPYLTIAHPPPPPAENALTVLTELLHTAHQPKRST